MTCKHAIPTKIYGRSDRNMSGPDMNTVVGMIFSEYPLDSATFEIVTLDFDNDFRGVDSNNYNRGANILTFAKTIGGFDCDIVSPIVMVTSSYQSFPINILVSGIISAVHPSSKRSPVVNHSGACSLNIITPSAKNADTITEWFFKLPQDIRLDRKVIYIKKFNMYISGCPKEQMEEIRDGNTLIVAQIGEPKPIVDIHVRGNIPSINTMYYNFNGISGKVDIEPSIDPVGIITLRVGGITLIENVSNKDLLSMEHSIYKLWDNFGGIELLIDYDQDRLSRTFDQLKSASRGVSPEMINVVNELRTEIVKLNDKLRDSEQHISDLKTRITDTEYKLKIEQEQHKTRREELKFHSTVSDQQNQKIIEFLKIGGAILGVVSLAITLGTKFQSNKTVAKAGLIEWAIPLLFKI